MRNWQRAQRLRDTRTTAEMDPASTTHRAPHTAHLTSRTTRRAPHAAHHTPARGLPEPQRDRALPNNVAGNSPRSFFDYASKRCNSNAANSKFEIVARELHAKLAEGPAVEGHEDDS